MDDFYTIQMVQNIRMDKAFLSHAVLSLDFGTSIHDPAGVKFGRAENSLHSVCQVKDYDLLITNDNVSEDFLIQVRELGVDIETVGLKEV